MSGFNALQTGLCLFGPGMGGGAPAPVADFEADDTTPAVDQAVQFTDLSTGATAWSWDFGDGTVSLVQNPLHAYAELGTFTVSLTVTNATGEDTEIKVGYITVTEYALSFTGLSAFPAGWTAPTWSVSANTAKNTPTEGTELLLNTSMEDGNPPTSWSQANTPTTFERSNTQAKTGTYSLHLATDAINEGAAQAVVGNTIGQWYKSRCWFYPTVGTAYRLRTSGTATLASSVTLSLNAWTEIVTIDRASASTTLTVRPESQTATTDFYIDDASLKLLTNLIATRDFEENDVIVKAAWTIPTYQAGVVALSDGTFDNCLKAGYNRAAGTAVLLQYVGGVATQLISVTTAYAAGADVELRVSANGTQADLYYNNAQVGATQAPNAAIQANTIAGLFSTDVSNTVSSFSVVAN